MIGVGGVLLGGHVGGLWGTIMGTYLGLTSEILHLEDIERKFQIELGPEDMMNVIVIDRERSHGVCHILQRYGAGCIRQPVAA